MKNLRPYQRKAVVEVVRSFLAGDDAVLLQSPVGSGKTFMAMNVLKQMRETYPDIKIAAIAHTRELVQQLREAAEDIGIGRHVYVQSVAMARQNSFAVQPNILVVDECHHIEAESYKKIIADLCEQPLVLGLTATPVRMDGKKLLKKDGGTFDKVVIAATIKELASLGNVLIPRIYTSKERLPNLSRIKRRDGDYDPGELCGVLNTPRLCGDVVEQYRKKAYGRQALVFAINREHAKSLKERFERSGFSAECVFGNEKEYRIKHVNDFRKGRIQILINLHICTEGWDYPELECVILACPTQSYVKYIQACGRCMRNISGKNTPVILDHGGCRHDHGHPAEERNFGEPEKEGYEREGPGGKECPGCGALQAMRALECKVCGYVFTAPGCQEELDEELVLIDEDKNRATEMLRFLQAAAKTLCGVDLIHN